MADPAILTDPPGPLDPGQVPILTLDAPAYDPAVNPLVIPDLPPALQPETGDVLLAQTRWPWSDLGAKGVPENWLYMSRRILGTIALMTVQTSVGPKLVKANPDGSIGTTVQSDNPPNYSRPSVANITPFTLLAANPMRRFYTVYNDAGSGTKLYLYATGPVASNSADHAFVVIPDGGYFESWIPCYTGLITGQFVGGVGDALVNEWT